MRLNIPCLAVILAFASAACGGGDSGAPATPGTGGSGGTGPTGPVTPVVASVVVTGAAAVNVGSTIQLAAQARDAAGAAIAGKTFTWTSASDAVATVASDGTVTGRAAGSTQISASVDGKTGSAAVTVAALPVATVATLVISGTFTLEIPKTAKLTAIAKDASGAVIADVPVTWSSSDATIISIGTDGTITPVRIGDATVTATAGGKTATAPVTSVLLPFIFFFPGTTSAADQQLIRDGVQQAQSFFQTAIGVNLQRSVTISGALIDPGCDSRSGNAAFTGRAVVTFCVGNAGWTSNGPVRKQKIVIHEVFHALQFEMGWLGGAVTGPDWILEGSAELMGYSGIVAKGLMTQATARGCQVKEMTDFSVRTPPGLPALSLLESHAQWQTTIGPTYTRAYLGMDELTAAGGLSTLKKYGDAVGAGTAWQTAFQNAFGQSISAFYAQYPAYESGLAVPPNYLCGV